MGRSSCPSLSRTQAQAAGGADYADGGAGTVPHSGQRPGGTVSSLHRRMEDEFQRLLLLTAAAVVGEPLAAVAMVDVPFRLGHANSSSVQFGGCEDVHRPRGRSLP